MSRREELYKWAVLRAEKWRRQHKQHEHLYPWVAYEAGLLSGYDAGFARAIEMLRSEEANKQSDAWVSDVRVFNNRPAVASNWADWLEGKKDD